MLLGQYLQSSTCCSPTITHRIEFYGFKDHEPMYTEERKRGDSKCTEILLRVKTPSSSMLIEMPPRSSEGFRQFQQIPWPWVPSRDSMAATGSAGGIGSVDVEGGRGEVAIFWSSIDVDGGSQWLGACCDSANILLVQLQL